MSAPWFNIQNRSGITVIDLFGEIGLELDGNEVIKALRSAKGPKVEMTINSQGGTALVGLAIANAVRASKIPVHAEIVGFALSAAANIAITCDHLSIHDGGFLMFHNASAFAAGGVQDLERTIDLMKKFDAEAISRVVSKTGESQKTVEQWFSEERWFSSSEALAAKLVDEVKPQTAKIAAQFNPTRLGYQNVPAELKGTITMSNHQPATVAELKAACVGAPADFILAQAEAGATVQSALTSWSAVQNAELRRLKAERSDPIGVPPLASGRGIAGVRADHDWEHGSAKDEFDARVRAKVASGIKRQAAVLAVAKAYPELHEAFIRETNEGRGVDHLINQRFARR